MRSLICSSRYVDASRTARQERRFDGKHVATTLGHDHCCGRAVASAVPDPQEAQNLITLLAGLTGLRNVSLTFEDSAALLTAEVAEGANAADRQIPSILPTLFTLWPYVTKVTLKVGPRQPIAFSRTEFPDEPERDLCGVGLIARKWLADSDGSPNIKADLDLVIRPHVDAVAEHYAVAAAQPYRSSAAVNAKNGIDDLCTRLEGSMQPHTDNVKELEELLRDARDSLAAWHKSRGLRHQRLRRSAEKRCSQVPPRLVRFRDGIAEKLSTLTRDS
jgi:hypothetical protein